MINLSELISGAYWPVTVLIMFGTLVFLFREKIAKFSLKTNYGELLVELNQEEKILDQKTNIELEKVDVLDIWTLNDLYKSPNGINFSTMNPVQKFAYEKLKKTSFLKIEGAIISLTPEGKKLVELANSIKL